MAEFGTAEMKDYLLPRQGQDVSEDQVRSDNNIVKGSKAWQAVPNILFQLQEQKLVRFKSRGVYHVIKKVLPLKVNLDEPERPLFPLNFPTDFQTGEAMPFAEHTIIREGDVILLAGMSNYFKTGLCMNFLSENINLNPVIMGNEYSIMVEKSPKHPQGYDIDPRFHNKLSTMSHLNTATGGRVHWRDENGNLKFVLLPVWGDYAEHIVKDKLNIVDWINLPGEYYMISPVMEKIKQALGRGVAILVIQKNEGLSYGMGGGRTKEFAQVEILLDKFGSNTDVLLTLGKIKEQDRDYKSFLTGRTYAFTPQWGVNILNLREVKPCPACRGTGYTKQVKCEMCWGSKFIDGAR